MIRSTRRIVAGVCAEVRYPGLPFKASELDFVVETCGNLFTIVCYSEEVIYFEPSEPLIFFGWLAYHKVRIIIIERSL